MPYQIIILGTYDSTGCSTNIYQTKLEAQELAIYYMYRRIDLVSMRLGLRYMYRQWCDSKLSSDIMIARLHSEIEEHFAFEIPQLVVVSLKKNTYIHNRKAKERAKKRKHYSKCLTM